MKHVQQFHFNHCKNSAVVTSVLRNLPFNMLDINLAGSTVSQVNIGKSFNWKFLSEDREGRGQNLIALEYGYISSGSQMWLLVQLISVLQVSAQEISNRLEKSYHIHTLNMSSVDLKRSDFMYLCQGLRLTLSLKDLNLSDTSKN